MKTTMEEVLVSWKKYWNWKKKKKLKWRNNEESDDYDDNRNRVCESKGIVMEIQKFVN